MERDVVAAGDHGRQEQQDWLDVLVRAKDYAGGTALKAEMQTAAEAKVAQGTSAEAFTESIDVRRDATSLHVMWCIHFAAFHR